MTRVALMMATLGSVSQRLNALPKEELPQEAAPLLLVSAVYVSLTFNFS